MLILNYKWKKMCKNKHTSSLIHKQMTEGGFNEKTLATLDLSLDNKNHDMSFFCSSVAKHK